MSKKKIALVNQRYGLEVNGGSEYYTRLIAEKLSMDYDVEVLTTRALHYDTWENYYEEGLQETGGIKVRRFTVDRKRSVILFRIVNYMIRLFKLRFLEQTWVDFQGPLTRDLISYINQNKNNYDVFIFVTYLYYHSIRGIPEVAEKSIFIPTAHDEPYIYFGIFKKIFHLPKAFIFLTEEERQLVHKTFHNETIMNEVIGIGIDLPEQIDSNEFRIKYNKTEPYVVYVGRIAKGKGCKILFNNFIKYKNENPNSNLKLVLMGQAMIDIPKQEDIISLGFVSEEDKYNGIAGARALILPSKYESLSISVLEAMSLGVPVIVNADCAVLKGHCDKSHGGLYYNCYDEFSDCMGQVLQNNESYSAMKSNARQYVKDNYTWDINMKKFQKILDRF